MTTLLDELGHNTTIPANYNKANFGGNFTGTTVLGLPVDSSRADDSYNPASPVHVSDSDVKALIPNLKVPRLALCTPYNYGGRGGTQAVHKDFGFNTNTQAWANAYCADLQRRGYNGVIIDYYGPLSYENQVTLLLMKACEGMTNFTFCLMPDQTGSSPTTTAGFLASMAYIKANYFPSPAYQRIKTPDGVNRYVIVPWGVPPTNIDNAAVYAQSAQFPLYRVWQGPSALTDPIAEAGYDWVQPYAGIQVPTDPYHLSAKQSMVNTFKGQSKGVVLTASPGFDDKLASWGKNRFIPRDWGKCWLAHNAFIAANLLPNLVFVMDSTNGDCEEGTNLAFGIDNGVTVNASLSGSTITWKTTGGTGDESTIDHYRVIASPDGTTSLLVALVPTGVGTATLASLPAGTYSIYVIAVGKGNIINRESMPVNFSRQATPPPTKTPIPFTIAGVGSGVFTPL